MKLQHVEIEGFMGIEHVDFPVGDGGVLLVGKSKSGKTRTINAIYAALKSRGYGVEFISDGADRWRVLLKFDAATVQTIQRRSGSKDVQVDGLGIGSPQAKLDAIFPDLIDPWRLAQDKPEERRRKVLAAMPAIATKDDMKRWTGDTWDVDESRHGLEVVADARKVYYDKRTAANKAVDDAKAAHKLAQAEAKRLESPAHVGVLVPLPGKEDEPVKLAQAAVEGLSRRMEQADEQEKRSAGTRGRVAKLREDAAGVLERAGSPLTENELHDAKSLVLKLRQQLEEAESNLRKLEQRGRDYEQMFDAAKAWSGQADELEASLASVSIIRPTEEEMIQAGLARDQAEEHRLLVRSARAAHDALVEAAALGDDVTTAQKEAKRLDAIVKRLDDEAVAELAARARMVPGLSFVGDDIALDGHVFKLLSESEKIELCVDLVKRMAPDAKLLRIDKLEGMDPDMREAFIRKAKAGGWQILGTVVERGEMRIVAIDADEEGAG